MKLTKLIVFICCLWAVPASAQIQTTIAILRTTATASLSQPYLITDQGKEGIFFYDSKDLNSFDNGGTVIVNGSKRYKRIYSGEIDGKWFGMKGDYNGTTGTDNAPAFKAAIAAAQKGETILVPNGQYLIKSSIAMPLTSVKKVTFEIRGDIFFTKGSGFIIEGANQIFKSSGMIVGGNTGATTEASYAAYLGDGIYLKNAYNCNIQVNEIKDFKNGIHASGDKSGGSPDGCQYNKIYFNSIHHNHTQIRISTKGTTTGGNWNNSSFWYGGQLGRGIPNVTFGKGGWYGIVFKKESTSNATDPMNGHMFHDVSFEGIEVAVLAANAEHNSFIGGRMEPYGSRRGFDFDPVTCSGNKIIGLPTLEEHNLTAGRLGINTVIEGTTIWTGTTSKVVGGNSATPSPMNGSKLLITTSKYTPTNFLVNKTHDLISQTGQFPSIQAMMYRLNGVIRSVPFKGTFLHVTPGTAGSPIVLPPNIGILRIEANQAKVFKIDVGDMAAYGENFIVEYLTPQYPISFIRSDNSAVLIAATNFPSGGTYRCLWVDGMYKVSKMGAEFRTFTQTGASYTIAEGIETHYVNYTANSTVTLPSAFAWPGRVITIKNLQAAKTVQVNGVSASDENLIQGRGAMTVKSDGKAWNIISFYKRNITY